MKNFFLAIAVLACLGVGVAIMATNSTGRPLVPNGKVEEAERAMAAVREAVKERAEHGENAEVPNAFCEETDHYFGMMDPLTVGTHVFRVQNKGSIPLTLQGGETTCKCTLSDLKEAIVEPGKSYSIKLTWNSGHSNRDFRQTAVVRTNDPTNPEIHLNVIGEVKAVLAALPKSVNLDRLLPEKKSSHFFSVYSHIWDSFKIERIETTNEHFTAEVFDGPFSQVVAINDEIENATAKKAIQITYDGMAERGQLSGYVRLYVVPPAEWRKRNQESLAQQEQSVTPEDSSTDRPPRIGFPMQEDGTILAEVPFGGTVIRRVSLYGKGVKKDGSIDLGSLSPKDTQGSTWNVIGRVRGEVVPTSIRAEVSGIPGLVVTAEKKESQRSVYSFGLKLELTKPLKQAIYNESQAGLLRIEAAGLPGEEGILEMPVNLIIVR